MPYFRDNVTGNVFLFESQHDVDSLRKHPEYTEVVEEKKDKPSKKQVKTEEV